MRSASQRGKNYMWGEKIGTLAYEPVTLCELLPVRFLPPLGRRRRVPCRRVVGNRAPRHRPEGSTSPAVEQECIDATREFRVHLMSEHLGKKIAGLEHPENVATVVQQMALQNYFGYRHGVRLPEHGALLRLPLEFDDATNTLAHGPLMVPAADFDEFLPDWPYDKAAFDKALGKTRKKNPAAFCPDDKDYMQWLWSCPGNWALLGGKIPA